MPIRLRLSLILLSVSLCASVPAGANGGHFRVDDASVTPPHNCELAGWASRRDDASFATLEPSCNFTGGSGWSLPMEFSLETDELATLGLEYKRVLWNWDSGPALAAVAGTEYDRPASELDTYYAYVPLSVQPMDSLTFHLNGGVEHSRMEDDTYATWGLAATFKPVRGPVWIVEAIDDDRRADPTYAVGLRTGIGSTAWTLDLGVARDTQFEETTYTLGINIPRLF